MLSLRQLVRCTRVVAPLLALAVVAAAQDNSNLPALVLRDSPEGVRVSAVGGALPSARVMRLSNPDRLVLDFDHTTLGVGGFQLKQWNARGIRVAFHPESESTRVVFDIPVGQQRWMRYDQNSMVVEYRSLLAKSGVVSADAAEPPATAGTASAQPVRPYVPSQPRTAAQQPRGTAAPANTTVLQALPTASKPDTWLQVSSHDGLLQVSARGVPFKSILEEVATASGASVQMLTPVQGNQNEIFEYGPAPALDVIRRLFEGSEYNYLVISEPNSTTRISRIVVTSKLTYSMGNDGLVSDDDTSPEKLQTIVPLPKRDVYTPDEHKPD